MHGKWSALSWLEIYCTCPSVNIVAVVTLTCLWMELKLSWMAAAATMNCGRCTHELTLSSQPRTRWEKIEGWCFHCTVMCSVITTREKCLLQCNLGAYAHLYIFLQYWDYWLNIVYFFHTQHLFFCLYCLPCVCVCVCACVCMHACVRACMCVCACVREREREKERERTDYLKSYAMIVTGS